MHCPVCAAPSGAPIYRHEGSPSITSTARVVAAPTAVYVCAACAHLHTPLVDDIGAYYDVAYNVHLESDEADDLYDVRAGVPVYRARHQANVVLEKLALAHGASVLDYGCGKSMTLQALRALRPDLDCCVFDVSDAYRAAWDTFVPRANQASFVPPAAWEGRFDAVLSFFALEHAADPVAFLRSVRGLLRPGGALHLTIPNVRRNTGDFIVVDHVNHFMPSSLRRAFRAAGFTAVRIDEDAHAAAYVVDAVRAQTPLPLEADDAGVAGFVADARGYAAFWSQAGAALAAFERDVARGRRSAVYGSAFYGVFIASRLADPGALACFLDRNPHQHAKRVLGKPVLAPEAVGDDVEVVYAGLNPARARDIIAGVAPLHRRERQYFYLAPREIAAATP